MSDRFLWYDLKFWNSFIWIWIWNLNELLDIYTRPQLQYIELHVACVMRQDLPASWPTLTVNPKSLDATPPAPARGRGRGRGRGTVKGTGKGEETQPLPKAKTQKKTTMSLLSSLVRTGNQMGNSGSWQIVLKQVKKIMADQLVLHSSDDLAGDCHGRLAINRSILVMLGKLNQDSSGAPSSVPASLQSSSEELLEFLDSDGGCTYWQYI